MAGERAAPRSGRATTYRGQNDMEEWWQWSMEVEEHSLPIFRSFIHRGDLVFDIGANRGRKTYLFRKLGARVIAVDPLFYFGSEFVPEFFWKWGKDPDVKAVRKAVTLEREVEIAINRFMPWISSMDNEWMTESAHAPKFGQPYYQPQALIKRKVPGITFDGLVNIYGQPRFMKVDVEGAENSAMATLSIAVPAFNMEFHRDWIPVAAMAHMDSLGEYEWNYALGNNGGFAGTWTDSTRLVKTLKRKLTPEGEGSWGDIYGRLVD